MTFILAINLCDRIYLAADTLGTKLIDDKRVPAEYCIKLIQMSNNDNSDFVNCLFSGNKRFIKYLFHYLTTAFDDGNLSTDINVLLGQIDTFFKGIVPLYPDQESDKVCKVIFAGCSSHESLKLFQHGNLSDVLGPEAGHIDDACAVNGIQHGFVDVPDQKIFSYIIDNKANIFKLEKIGEMYSVIHGGSRKLSNEEEKLLLKHFLSRRDTENEVRDVVNFLRNQFTDAIGGAVTFGHIDRRKRLIYWGYDVDRSRGVSDTNWSFTIEDDGPTATDPNGVKHNLVKPFYDIPMNEVSHDLEI